MCFQGDYPSICLLCVYFDKIKEIIRQGIEVPEGQNDLRRQQLRELALLNGTLRENDALGYVENSMIILHLVYHMFMFDIICQSCAGIRSLALCPHINAL